MGDGLLTVGEFLDELQFDISSWFSVDQYPDSLTCRNMVWLADFAAEKPEIWKTAKMAFYHPQLTQEELGKRLSVSSATIGNRLRDAKLMFERLNREEEV